MAFARGNRASVGNPAHLSHGESRRGATSPEYYVWTGMISRCTNPNRQCYPHYGGRGIRVCDRWRSFEAFLADMGRRPSAEHTLERLDVNGHYEPGNVIWMLASKQPRNTRRSNVLEFNGERHCLTEWAEIRGMTREALNNRIRRGWPVGEALGYIPHSAADHKGR